MYTYDDDDIGYADMVGAPRRALRQRRRGARKASRRARRGDDQPMGGETEGRWLSPGTQRRLVLGLGTVSVPAGGTAELKTTIQRPIQGDRLILSASDDGALIGVEDVQVGVRSQYNSTTSAPIAAFQHNSVRCEFSMDPGGTGVDFTVSLSNPTAAAVTVAGALYGASAE